MTSRARTQLKRVGVAEGDGGSPPQIERSDARRPLRIRLSRNGAQGGVAEGGGVPSQIDRSAPGARSHVDGSELGAEGGAAEGDGGTSPHRSNLSDVPAPTSQKSGQSRIFGK